MSLQSIAEFNPDYYQESSLSSDLISRPVFIAETNEEIGIVEDVLVDESGHFRYLVIDASSWLPERKFLLPIGRCRAAQEDNSISLMDINDKQVFESLPPYENYSQVDYDYEENIRNVYRQLLTTTEDSATNSYDRDSYSYEHEPELYQLSPEHSQTFKLYEERLVTEKQRQEVGEVTIGKRIETETAEVEVPVEKEKVVVKINEVAEDNIVDDSEEANFEEVTVAKVKVYEETANIDKKAFVRQEVEIKKEVEKETVTTSETLRKEELEITGKENVEMEK